ncbi:hypothetical protein Patl1_06868 [Pistacia atlantica]|uniref:Uncharacterized protein n=1 Tax=Pistacia atlantica TaxID=434234 RepID=A0ACC1AFN0_9ROSI|nr:hypothetical protein Patl1_06868 [Pistacia atlantica]
MVHAIFEDLDIVIVGGGICGLATALALHRKGMKSVVLEKSETLRASGGAIAIQPNGWRALDELGVASKLRSNGIRLERMHEIYLNGGKPREKFVDYSNIGEIRWVKRSDLIESLAQDLPLGTVRVGCQIFAVKIDANTSFPTLQLNDGTIIRAKKLHPSSGVRGFTYFPNGHGFAPELLRTIRDKTMAGVAPVNDNLLFWFVNHQYNYQDSKMVEDPKMIKQMVLETIKGFPQKTIDVIQNCDISSPSFNRLRYRAPWDILLGQYRRGTVTVAGDSMHAMTPFIGQGGSASIEDAVVLARCMARKFQANYNNDHKDFKSKKMIEEAIDEYVNERRMRLVKLALQSYLSGTLVDTPYMLVKLIMLVLLSAFFRDKYAHVRYNCGNL